MVKRLISVDNKDRLSNNNIIDKQSMLLTSMHNGKKNRA